MAEGHDRRAFQPVGNPMAGLQPTNRDPGVGYMDAFYHSYLQNAEALAGFGHPGGLGGQVDLSVGHTGIPDPVMQSLQYGINPYNSYMQVALMMEQMKNASAHRLPGHPRSMWSGLGALNSTANDGTPHGYIDQDSVVPKENQSGKEVAGSNHSDQIKHSSFKNAENNTVTRAKGGKSVRVRV